MQDSKADTAGFDLVNWFDYLKIDVVTLTFSPDVLEGLPSYGKVPDGYEGYPYDATYGSIKLFVEEIDDGMYHVSIRDYSCGWTRDLGDGNYDFDYDLHPGWSGLERILDDLERRISSGEIDLDRALMEYYTVGDDGLRMKPCNVTKAGKEDPETQARKRLANLENKDFATACMVLMRKGGISPEDVEKLADKDYCDAEFGNARPILKRTFAKGPEVPRDEAKVDGSQRYYYAVHELAGRRYIVTNEWHGLRKGARRNNRAPFVDWMLKRISLR